jgi:hypothetical protein
MKGITTRDIEHYSPACNTRGTIKAGTPVHYVQKSGWASWVLTNRPDWMWDWDWQHHFVDVPADAVQEVP